jgi:hypothetical protein
LRDARVALLKFRQDGPVDVGGVTVPSYRVDVLTGTIDDGLRE